MTGIGGGVLVMPSLIYILGFSPVSAVGTGLLYSMLARVYAIYEHLRLRTVRKRTAFYIGLGGVPAVIVTSFLITHLSKTAGESLNFILKVIISAVILITWALMLINLIRYYKDGSKDYYVPPKVFPLRRKLYGILAGAGVGILIGSTSIGGGVLIVPILVTIFQLSPSNTVGTSNLIAIIMSAVGSIIYFLGGSVDASAALIMFIGSIPGVWLGARAAVRVPHRKLEIILFCVITISAIVMLVGIRY